MEVKKQAKWLMLLSGIAVIALGIVTMIRPAAGLMTVVVFFGIVLLFSGICEIAAYLIRDKSKRSGGMLASGILTNLLGIWVLFGRGMDVVATIIPFIFAIWVMASGLTRIADALSSKEGERRSIWKIVFATIATVFGFVLMFNPLMSVRVIGILVSLMLLSYGIGTVQLFFALRWQDRHGVVVPEVKED